MIPNAFRKRILGLKCIPVEIEGKVIALQPKEESFKKLKETYPEYEVLIMPYVCLLKHNEKCTPLCTIGFKDFTEVRDMSEMFDGCNSLQTLDLSNFDTSNVTEMFAMFANCSSLQTLDLSNFDTSEVKDMSWIFSNCSSLRTLDLSNFDTSKVTEMFAMFSSCKSLQTLDLSNFDTSRTKDMREMFSGCQSLQTVILNKEKNPQVVAELQELDHEVKIIEPTQKEQSVVTASNAFS